MAGDKDTKPTVNEKMTAIADAIRDKTGGTESLTLDDMAENIPTVYEVGKKAEYNNFWDNFNYSGRNCFSGQGWNKKTFKPNKDFYVQQDTFYYHNWQGEAYDLAAHLEELGVTMRMGSNARREGFYVAWFTRLPVLDFSARTGTFDSTFYSALGSPLVTIDKIILPPEGSVTGFSSTFYNCSKLKNITFEGVIDKSISFSASPLSVASMKNIISCLKDFSGTDSEFTYKVTFSSACITTLEAEGTTAEYNGEACTWIDLINNKKWNS